MIQINLLPDVKREYLKSQQQKHLFIIASVIVSLIAISGLVLLFLYVQVIQPRHRANLQKDIDSGIQTLKNTKDAVKIVTVQGVLEQIPALQDTKMITSNIFGYLTDFTPQNVSYSEVRLDLTSSTLSLSGETTTLEQTNVLANNLKSASFVYTQSEKQQSLQPFSEIVFGSLGKTSDSTNGKGVTFQIDMKINPQIFKQDVKKGKINVNGSSEQLLLPTDDLFTDIAKPGVTP